MISYRRPFASSAISVFLVGLLASRPSTAAADTPTEDAQPPFTPATPSPPPSEVPGNDPWQQPSRVGSSPNPQGYQPGPAAPGQGMGPYQPLYPYFTPNPEIAGSPAAANPYAMGGVFVELMSPSRPVRIERVVSPNLTVPVCVSPCRQVLPRNSVYIITGDGVRSTSQFVLPDDRNRVRLDVKPASSGDVLVGALAMGGGLLAAYLGLVFVVSSEFDSYRDPEDRRSTGPGKTVGGLMIVGGLVTGIIGLYYVINAKTVVTSSTGSQFSETPSRQGSRFAFTARGLEF